jgi:hypothetical protein
MGFPGKEADLMSGSTTGKQEQSQQSQTQPWLPAIPMLNNILGQVGNANLSPTAGQTGAVNTITGEAGGIPSFAPQATNAVGNLFGSSTTPQQNMLTDAYRRSSGALSPMLDAGYTDPYTNPALRQAMGTMNSDITNQINSQFAAAGRPAGTNADSAQALARGLSQGEGGLLANEFNTLTSNQMGAAGQLNSMAGNTAGGLTAQQQVPLANAVTGMGAAAAIPGLATSPGQTQLMAANLQAGLPISNLGEIEKLTLPIAGMGASSTGTGTSTTEQKSPWWTTALGAGMMAASMYSDERVKEDIAPVGMLYDETPVFSYRYKGDPTPRIGLIAQDVETRRPDAVTEIGGIKAVHYGKATERARAIGGMLDDMAMAA